MSSSVVVRPEAICKINLMLGAYGLLTFVPFDFRDSEGRNTGNTTKFVLPVSAWHHTSSLNSTFSMLMRAPCHMLSAWSPNLVRTLVAETQNSCTAGDTLGGI